jgi:sigma-B regulation protein RsbU (phosphoserine phosphatase)
MVLVRPGRTPELAALPTGKVAGVTPGLRLTRRAIEVRPGDTLVLYTDGVTEAADEQDRLFGEERLLAQLDAEPGSAAAGTVAGLSEAVKRFAGRRDPADDIAILALRRRP